MQKTAFLFPGQGSQFVGMGRDLYEQFPEAQALFEEADDVLGLPLSAMMFGTNGVEGADAAETLKQTEITQPALYVHSLAAVTLLRQRGIEPDMVAGHSLGEYSALAAAGAISFDAGLRAVRQRGELMAHAGDERPGTMAAVLGLDDDDVSALCVEASEMPGSVVQPANYNSPGQIVISGDVPAVERAMTLARERGAKRVLPLPVSGAFHSPLMEQARDGLADALAHLHIQPPRCPVYLNVTATPSTDPHEILGYLLDQLMSAVRWAPSLRQMHADGATRFVEVGAGRVLSGLVRRTLGRDVEILQAGTANDMVALDVER